MGCKCGAERETIEHLVCECPLLSSKRRNLGLKNVTAEILVEDPETGQRLLEGRFLGLQIQDENATDDGGGAPPPITQC